MNNYIITR